LIIELTILAGTLIVAFFGYLVAGWAGEAVWLCFLIGCAIAGVLNDRLRKGAEEKRRAEAFRQAAARLEADAVAGISRPLPLTDAVALQAIRGLGRLMNRTGQQRKHLP
jgi:hypothetical protein